jgi:hypothetical protein
MKKTVLIASVIFLSMNTFSQTITLLNGGFESGSFEKNSRNASGAENWYWQAAQDKVPGSSIELSTEEKHQGNKSVKITATGEITARYHVALVKKIGVIPKLNYTLTFWAKSNTEVKLNCNFDGMYLKDGVLAKNGTPGDVIVISGGNKWKKYTLTLKGRLFSNATYDFTQPSNFNLGLEKQTISDNLELYLDDLELLD